MDKDDLFDLEKFRLGPEDLKAYVGKAAATARARRRDRFIIVPGTWADRLAAARHASTLKLALHLLHQHWKNGGQPVPLSNVSLTSAGIGRRSKWRALGELERLKLIEIERRRRKSPLITPLKTRSIKGDHHG